MTTWGKFGLELGKQAKSLKLPAATGNGKLKLSKLPGQNMLLNSRETDIRQHPVSSLLFSVIFICLAATNSDVEIVNDFCLRIRKKCNLLTENSAHDLAG